MILYSQDCIDVGLCTRGQMRFCRAHDINFRRFLAEGISLDRLNGIEDLNLSRALTRAMSREEGGE